MSQDQWGIYKTMSTTDQVSEETTEEESEEEESSEEETEEETKKQSKEPDKPKLSLKETHRLAKAVQKGYTITRQELNQMRENQEAIQTALEELKKSKDEFDFDDEDKPLTIKDFLKLQSEEKEKIASEDKKLQDKITSQLAELRAEGVIKTKEEEDDLLKYAVKYKITDLTRAGKQWRELQDAKKASKKTKDKAKTEERRKEGKKVGTSKKTGKKSGGVDYNEIRSKDITQIAEEAE